MTKVILAALALAATSSAQANELKPYLKIECQGVVSPVSVRLNATTDLAGTFNVDTIEAGFIFAPSTPVNDQLENWKREGLTTKVEGSITGSRGEHTIYHIMYPAWVVTDESQEFAASLSVSGELVKGDFTLRCKVTGTQPISSEHDYRYDYKP